MLLGRAILCCTERAQSKNLNVGHECILLIPSDSFFSFILCSHIIPTTDIFPKTVIPFCSGRSGFLWIRYFWEKSWWIISLKTVRSTEQKEWSSQMVGEWNAKTAKQKLNTISSHKYHIHHVTELQVDLVDNVMVPDYWHRLSNGFIIGKFRSQINSYIRIHPI